jgi:polysaccharide deacetylase 2 family uncharacterized protein YibQ
VIRRFFSFLVSRLAPWVIILLNVGFLVFVVLVLFVFQGTKEDSDVLALLKKADHVTSEKDTSEKDTPPTASAETLPKEIPVPDAPLPVATIGQDLVERSAFGFLPKRGTGEDRTPWQVYARSDLWPQDPPYARVSLVVEQMGMNQALLDQAKKTLPPGVALAFNPYAGEVFSQMQTARQAGFETLLSLALETRNYPYSDPGSLALLTANLPEKNQEKLSQQMATAQGYMGMIPMMGKIARYDAPLMDLVLGQLGTRGLMYVDTAEGTQAEVHEKRSKNADLPYIHVTLRLQSVEEREAFFKNLAQTALKQGSAVGLLPPYPIIFETVAAWVKALPQTYAQLTFVPVSYQGRLFLDAPKPPEPEPEPAAHAPEDKDKKGKEDPKKKDAPKPKAEGGGH